MSKNIHILFIVLAFVASQNSLAQSKKKAPARKSNGIHSMDVKKKKEIKYINLNTQVGMGIMRSVLYLARNVKQNNDGNGYTIIANYGGQKFYRISAQYTHYLPIDIGPTWYDITADSYETNFEILARFKDGATYIYPIAGLSYNVFRGYFTGVYDYLNLRQKYQVNSVVTTRWLGLNAGAGIEHTFGPIVVFGDYRMRIGRMEEGGFNIMDLCYSAGIRIKLFAPTGPTIHKLFRGVNDKYHWF